MFYLHAITVWALVFGGLLTPLAHANETVTEFCNRGNSAVAEGAVKLWTVPPPPQRPPPPFKTLADVDLNAKVVHLNKDRELAPGVSNEGILRVKFKDGSEHVVKLSYRSSFDEKRDGRTTKQFDGNSTKFAPFRDYLTIHQMLGEKGYAPKIEGVMLGEETENFVAHLNRKGFRLNEMGSVGIVMEEIPQAWNFVAVHSSVRPPYVAKWKQADVEALLLRMKEIEGFLNKNHLVAQDVQFFVSQPEKGPPRILLGDVDPIRFAKTPYEVNNFRYAMDVLVSRWEAASGEKFPDTLFELIARRPRRAG